MSHLKELRNRFGTLKRSISYSKESEIMALGSNDSKVRVYTIPNIKNMSRINTLIGCKGPIKGCWVGGETGLDVIAVDQIGMVCMWQQDYQRTELEFSLDVSFLHTPPSKNPTVPSKIESRNPGQNPRVESAGQKTIGTIKCCRNSKNTF